MAYEGYNGGALPNPLARVQCTIGVDDGGYYIVCGTGEIVASGLITAGDAVEEAEAEGLTILNMDEVERWMQPPDDWGIDEPEAN